MKLSWVLLFTVWLLQTLFNVLYAGIPHGVSWTFDATYMYEKRKAAFDNDTSQTCWPSRSVCYLISTTFCR